MMAKKKLVFRVKKVYNSPVNIKRIHYAKSKNQFISSRRSAQERVL